MANEFKHATVGSVLTQTEYEGTAGDTHNLDGQATGDFIYASNGTLLRRLAIGSAGAHMQVNSGIPAWDGTFTAKKDFAAAIEQQGGQGGTVDFFYSTGTRITNITAYQTIFTIAPAATGNVNTVGLVEAYAMGNGAAVGNGLVKAAWYYDYNSGVPTVGTIAANATSGIPPLFRLNVSGTAIQCQVQSSTGVSRFDGMLWVRIYAPSGAGTQPVWTVS